MVVKVKDGTRSGQSLCTTCSYSQILKGSSDSEEVTICSRLEGWRGGRVPFKIVECNEWADKSKPSLSDMRQTAWVLSTDKKKHFGFQSPKDWRKSREDNDDGLDDINTDYPGAR